MGSVQQWHFGALALILALLTSSICANVAHVEHVVAKSKDRTFSIDNMDQWQTWVLSKAKNYNALLLITVGDAFKSQCQHCPQFRKMYGILSAIYHARRDNNMPDIKFGVLEYRQQTAPIVASLGINHVPMVMLFKPHSDQPIIADLQAGLPPFLQQQLGLELNWNDVSGVDPTLLKEGQQEAEEEQLSPAAERIMKIIFLIVVVVLFVTIGFTIYSYAGNKITALMTLACIVYMFCMGGIVYNTLNQPPLYYHNPYQQNKLVIFLPQHMGQLALEGYIATFTMIVSALALIALVVYVPSMSSENSKRLSALALMAVFYGGILCLTIFYLHKSAWYLTDTPIWPLIGLLREIFVPK